MQRKLNPAIDPTIAPGLGITRDGQPLSYNRAPAPDLAPWIARLYVTIVDAPRDYHLHCGLLADTAFLRVQLAGGWKAETADGPISCGRAALFLGPNAVRMPMEVTGSFISLGISLRPGACTALKAPPVADHVDRIVPIDRFMPGGCDLLDLFEADEPLENWLETLENVMRDRVALANRATPDPVTTQFETLAFADPAIPVSAAAERCGVDKRTLERIVNRDFGMPPKQVLKRARALDMASQLRGVIDGSEEEEIFLRYYDDSHLIREFTELFGMSPRQFVATPQPIMTLALESRQARRLELLKRIEPGQLRPWELPDGR